MIDLHTILNDKIIKPICLICLLAVIIVAFNAVMQREAKTKDDKAPQQREYLKQLRALNAGYCVMIGENAGALFTVSPYSHVFIGPEAGNSAATMNEKPLVEITGRDGKPLFWIDANGEYKAFRSPAEIKASFKPLLRTQQDIREWNDENSN
jgi:hypothetical protein